MSGYVKGLPNETSVRIGNNIKFLRKLKNANQSQVGSVLGIGFRSISFFETGRRLPSQDQLKKLSAYFDVSKEKIENEVITSENEIYISEKTGISLEKFVDKLLVDLQFPSEYKNDKFEETFELLNNLSLEDISLCRLAAFRNRFYKSFLTSGMISDAAYTLFILCCECCYYIGVPLNSDLSIKNVIKLCDSVSDSMINSKKRFVINTKDMYNECLLVLRNNSITRDLFEFFLSLKYCIGMTEEADSDKRLISSIGLYMLFDFANLGNKHCESFLEILHYASKGVENFFEY